MRGLKRAYTDENSFIIETPGISKTRRTRSVDFNQLQNLQQEYTRNKEAQQRAEDKAKIEAALASISKIGFPSLYSLINAIHQSKDQQISASFSRMLRHHGLSILDAFHERQPEILKKFTLNYAGDIISKETRALAEYLRPGEHASTMGTLSKFSLDTILSEAEEIAPSLLFMLRNTAKKDQGSTRKDADLVIVTVLCMLAQTRNEKACTFQTNMCLYLLACGASRTQFDILNHAGISLSYTSAMRKVKDLGQEKLAEIVDIAHRSPFLIIWDNLNIAFRVGEQRKASKDHFDNGTTATLIPLYGVQPGDLPLELKPPRLTRQPVLDIKSDHFLPSLEQVRALEVEMIWHIEDILFNTYPALKARFRDSIPAPPSVDPIPLHKTEQYPLPAMHIDESSLDGTLKVLETILSKTLKMDADAIRKHGIVLCAGDQLTISLLDKASASRREDTDLVDNISRYTEGQLGLFHVKIAGDRMIANEFWGVPNSDSPWSLWKLNSLLGRKAISAGWKAKSPTPFRQTYELILSLALPAHVLDAFRIYCPFESVDKWVEKVKSYEDIHDVAVEIHQQLCSARRVYELRQMKQRDIPLENIILFIRDALILRTLKSAIKRGDIGSVINVLSHWMVMFRGTGKMPKYADALFHLLVHLKQMNHRLRDAFLKNWLANLTGRVDGFKEMDLLQEHQNFWAKVIYNARGSNRSWAWLTMITVSIFALRDVIRQVQLSYRIPYNSHVHASPSTTADVQDLRDYLQSETLQTYTPDRPFNDKATPARDLFSAGAAYANTASAFKNFRRDTRSAINLGSCPTAEASYEATEEEDDNDDSNNDLGDDIGLDLEDLSLDSEEFPAGLNPQDLVEVVQDTITELSLYD